MDDHNRGLFYVLTKLSLVMFKKNKIKKPLEEELIMDISIYYVPEYLTL